MAFDGQHSHGLSVILSGSILGPLLCLLYINDLPAVSKLSMPILFADDTNLFCTSHNVNSFIEKIKRELVNVYAWVQSNKLSLNIDKTNYMLFSPKCACKPPWDTFQTKIQKVLGL